MARERRVDIIRWSRIVREQMRIGVFAHHVCLSAITETFCHSDLVLCSFDTINMSSIFVCVKSRDNRYLFNILSKKQQKHIHMEHIKVSRVRTTHLMSTYSDKTTNNRNSAVKINICLYHAEEEVHLIVFTVHV